MTDRPMLFSAPMVRAQLADTKTQTRRFLDAWTDEAPAFVMDGRITALDENDKPYTWPRTRAVGDRLWVKETSRITSWGEDGEIWLTYAADDARSGMLTPRDEDFLERLCARVEKAGAETDAAGNYVNIPPGALVKPSIFMPRWASRLTLTVTDVRVERLQDISETDALAEGMTQATADAIMGPEELAVYATTHIVCPEARGRILYETIWDQINGDGAWAKNPWVAAYTFTVELGNIDQLRAA